MKKVLFILTVAFLAGANVLFSGTTGKITGTITDKESGEALPMVNVMITGTSIGAASDLKGYYVILNLPPGTYAIQASMMGYQATQISNVQVKIDQTTVVNFSLTPSALTGEEITVVAERPIVESDIAASKLNISTEQLEVLPATTVNEVVGLQAGVSTDLSIRGGAPAQTMFMVDGIVLRDERDNRPISSIPLSSIQEVSVQTGGFSAEYSHVRSGIVNVVTREGNKERFSGSITYKIRPPDPKHFGISPFDPAAFWLRPYLDDAVCWTGTEQGGWDIYTQRQYPKFDGWNKIAAQTTNDDNPANDLTPAGAQRIFRWEHRKQGDIDKPDYNIDLGFGGVVPVIGQSLGNLRFWASYFREQDMYIYELSRDALTNESALLKLTSDLSPQMKMSLQGLYGETFGTSSSLTGATSLMEDSWDVVGTLNQTGFTIPWRIFTDIYWTPTARYFHSISAKFTHLINPKTFYEVQLQRFGIKYFTSPAAYRDRTKKYEIFPGYFLDEAPEGFAEDPIFGIDGLGMGGAVSTARDYSRDANTSLKADLTSQINSHHEIKTGAEFAYQQLNLNFGMVNKFLPEGNAWTKINRNPYRFNFYAQDKIEVKGFIATLGFIMDYVNPNGNWYTVDDYNKAFYSQNYLPENENQIPTKPMKVQFNVSPRLAISHPITDNSKLYFNYGHYRQMPTSERRFRNERALNYQLAYIGDPTIPLAQTVAYELGYDHALFESYLLHLSAYYKDITDQEDWTRFISLDGKVNYYKLTANSYEDIRGFEIELRKRFGRWLMGNLNYEYRVETAGHFDFSQYNENPADQRKFERDNPQQEKPRPRPRFKSYLDFHTPVDFGPKYLSLTPLGEWHFNVLTYWTAGNWFTWNPNSIPGIEYNVQWKDSYVFDFKISKTFTIRDFDLRLFMDIFNIFNIQEFSGISFHDIHDYNYYMRSLHLPKSDGAQLGYGNIPGDDQPGDYRNESVAYVPMEYVTEISKVSNPNQRAIYYDASAKKYLQFSENNWIEVAQSRIDQIKKDKAYIDMPNQSYFTFLNPRNIFFGVTLNYNF